MAKYLITIIILILIAGCIFKDENKKGTLNFSITWPEKSIKTKAIPSTCEKIIISLYKYGEESNELSIEKEIIRESSKTTENVTIEDLEKGKWDLSVTAYDINGNSLAYIFELIDIKEGSNSYEAVFGMPLKTYQSNPISGAAINIDTAVTLNWYSVKSNYTTADAILDTINYKIYFGESADLTDVDILNKDTVLTSTQQSVYMTYSNLPVLEQGKTYYWKIKSENSIGAVFGPTASFRIKNIVEQPVNVAPTSGAAIASGELAEFVWSVASDLEEDNNYQVIVERTPIAGGATETKYFPETGYITNTTYTLNITEQSWFIYGYYYYWYVVINDMNGETAGTSTGFIISAP